MGRVSLDTRRLTARLIAIGALAWVALIVLAPLLQPMIAALVYGVGSFICHQIPERSFHLAGSQLPVCGRCVGIYVGFAMAAALNRRTLRASAARRLVAAAAMPTMVTVALEWLNAWAGTNVVRAAAGWALGAGVGVVVMSALATLHYSSCAPPRQTEPNQLPPSI